MQPFIDFVKSLDIKDKTLVECTLEICKLDNLNMEAFLENVINDNNVNDIAVIYEGYLTYIKDNVRSFTKSDPKLHDISSTFIKELHEDPYLVLELTPLQLRKKPDMLLHAVGEYQNINDAEAVYRSKALGFMLYLYTHEKKNINQIFVYDDHTVNNMVNIKELLVNPNVLDTISDICELSNRLKMFISIRYHQYKTYTKEMEYKKVVKDPEKEKEILIKRKIDFIERAKNDPSLQSADLSDIGKNIYIPEEPKKRGLTKAQEAKLAEREWAGN